MNFEGDTKQPDHIICLQILCLSDRFWQPRILDGRWVIRRDVFLGKQLCIGKSFSLFIPELGVSSTESPYDVCLLLSFLSSQLTHHQHHEGTK